MITYDDLNMSAETAKAMADTIVEELTKGLSSMNGTPVFGIYKEEGD